MQQSAASRRLRLAVAFVLMTAWPVLHAHAVTVTWTGQAGNSNWNATGNWDPDTAWPDNTATDHFDVVIPGGAVVNANTYADVDTLTIGSGATVDILSNCRIGIEGSSLSNEGVLKMSSAAGNVARLIIDGSATLSGGGELQLSASVSNQIQGDGAGQLTNYNAIRGAGQIGNDMNVALSLINHGVIEATFTEAALTINPDDNAAGYSLTNMNVLRAAGGALVLDDGTYDNLGGAIESSGADATVTLNSGAFISGGVLRSNDGGKLLVAAYHANPATLRFVELGGVLQVQAGTALALEGWNATNDSTIALEGATGNRAVLEVTADAILRGGGTVTLAESGQNWLVGDDVAGQFRKLTNEDNTIKGAGEIGSDANGPLTIVNSGTIEASFKDKTLIVDPDETNPLGALENLASGKLRATGGATLELRDGVYMNYGGVIEAVGEDSKVLLGAGVRIEDGTLRVEDGGNIYAAAAAGAAPVIADVTIEGDSPFHVPASTSLVLEGRIVGNTLVGVGEFSTDDALLTVRGEVELEGNGGVKLLSPYSGIIGDGADSRLVIGKDQVIGAHSGGLGGNTMAVTNHGAIWLDAEENIPPILAIDPINGPGGFINRNTITVFPGAGIFLGDGTYDNAGGTIKAKGVEAEVLVLNDVDITGGTLETEFHGVFHIVAPHATPAVFRDLKIAGAASTSSGDVKVSRDCTLVLEGTIENTSTIELTTDETLGTSKLVVNGPVSLTDAGGVILTEVQKSHIAGDGTNPRLTVGADQWILGSGQFGMDTLAITNHGNIMTDAGHLVINPLNNPADSQWGVINHGRIIAQNGALLELKGGDYRNYDRISAGLNSNMRLYGGVRIFGGFLLAHETGFIRIMSSTTGAPVHLSSVDLGGAVVVEPGATLSMAGNGDMLFGIVLSGEPNAPAKLVLNNQATPTSWTGGGGIALIGGPTLASVLGTGGQWINNEAFSILGDGRIGDDAQGPLTLTNRGEITATPATNATGTIHIDPLDAADSFINEGLLHARADGTILVDDGDVLNRGEVLVYAGGALTVSGTFNQAAGETTIHGEMTVLGGDPTFAPGTKVGGFGKINGKPANVWGRIAPGDSVGTLQFEGLHLRHGARIEIEIDGDAADAIHVFGTTPDALQLDDGATYFIDLTVLDRGDVDSPAEFPILTWGGPLTLDRGHFDAITWDFGRSADALFDTPEVEFRPNADGIGGSLVLSNVLLVPEPSAAASILIALLSLAVVRHRRCGARFLTCQCSSMVPWHVGKRAPQLHRPE